MSERTFKGLWMPASLYTCPDLEWIYKILLLEIWSFDNGEGCYKTNASLGKSIHKSKDRAAHMVMELRERGLIETTEVVKNNIPIRNIRLTKKGKELVTGYAEYADRGLGDSDIKGLGDSDKKVIHVQSIITTDVKPEVLDKPSSGDKVDWDNCKTDQQRFAAYFLRKCEPTLYSGATKGQATAFFKRYGRDLSAITQMSGSLDVAKRALDKFALDFNGRTWNLTTFTRNLFDYVNYAMGKGGLK